MPQPKVGWMKEQFYNEGWADCVKALNATGVEWSVISGSEPNYVGNRCPVCHGNEHGGHLPTCTLAAILKSTEKQ